MYDYNYTVRDTENLTFSTDMLCRFFEGSRAAIRGRPCGNTQIVCAANARIYTMRKKSADKHVSVQTRSKTGIWCKCTS